MEHSLWLWAGFNVFVLLLLAFDLGVVHRKEREINVREALTLSFGYFLLAMLFNAGIFYFMGHQKGMEFLTGYLIEKSLSLDNIFIFVLLFGHFAVPRLHQHRILFWGIIGALIMRGLLICVGAALIAKFHWIIFLFGGFLLITGLKMLWITDHEPEVKDNKIVQFMRKYFRVTQEDHGQNFVVWNKGKLWITPLFIVLVMIECTDLVFALDSIPAIFAITHDPFIVYTSNVFAILGLRALYFALAGIIHRFHYLKYGLALVLVCIGAKMLVNAYFGTTVVPTELALLVTAFLIFGSMAISLLKTRGEEASLESATSENNDH